MKRACDDHVRWFLDIEAAVGDNDEDEEGDEEDNEGASPGVLDWCPSLQGPLGGFVEDEPVLNPHYRPSRQVYKSSDREDGWQDLIASLGERYASGSKTIPHIIEDNE